MPSKLADGSSAAIPMLDWSARSTPRPDPPRTGPRRSGLSSNRKPRPLLAGRARVAEAAASDFRVGETSRAVCFISRGAAGAKRPAANPVGATTAAVAAQRNNSSPRKLDIFYSMTGSRAGRRGTSTRFGAVGRGGAGAAQAKGRQRQCVINGRKAAPGTYGLQRAVRAVLATFLTRAYSGTRDEREQRAMSWMR